MVNGGGWSAQTTTLLHNSIVFENIIYIFNYTQLELWGPMAPLI